jgi:hypothetical protein
MQCKYPTDGPGAFLAAAAAVRASARRTVRQATGREDVATAHGAATHQAEANKRAAVAWRACCCMRFCKQSRSKYCGPPVRLCLCVCVTVYLSVCQSGSCSCITQAGLDGCRPDGTRGPGSSPQPQLQASSEQKKKRRACGLQ